MDFRRLVILHASDGVNAELQHVLNRYAVAAMCWLGEEAPVAPSLPFVPFARAANLLGREFDLIIYDARRALNLEALAIAAGTLKAGGLLLMLCHRQTGSDLRKDADSLRWSGEKQPIFTPHFNAFWRQKIAQHRIPVCSRLQEIDFGRQSAVEKNAVFLPKRATGEQQAIIAEILKRQAEIYIVTAKRGRGKSALAGLLIKELAPTERVILTAPNKSAVKILQDFAACEPAFIAPDELCRQIRQNPSQFRRDWLFIDEAAMIPLHLLDCLTSAFRHILCTTTVHSYEGTGRGFLLKFIKKIDRTFRRFELGKPLRWARNDPLERFIEDLLLLDAEDSLLQPDYAADAAIRLRSVSQAELAEIPEAFYGLLTLAHYRTSPLDLRRLFDAPKQRFWLAEKETDLVGCVWAPEEGGLTDEELIRDICRGLRRPPGNLAAQALAFQSDLPQACRLTSLRISRIAVQPKWRRHGIGRRLIAAAAQSAGTDFLSVSFGYTPQLLQFWRQCGFVPVHMGERKEASSGCYSMIALRPLSPAGADLVRRAEWHFQRNIGLSFHPLAAQFGGETDWRLTEEDWRILQNFADFDRTLSGSLGAIRRLMAISDVKDCPLLTEYCSRRTANGLRAGGKRQWLRQCRTEVKKMIEKARKNA